MKKYLPLAGAGLLLALFVSGCASSDIAARTQEKSAAYASLKAWEKNDIAKGVIVTGFTPDMVYMAVGHPTHVKAEGDSELWTYNNYYPNIDASTMRYAEYRTETPYQPGRFTDANSPNTMLVDYEGDEPSPTFSPGNIGKPVGMSTTPASVATTGGPQGGTIEPGDLEAFTLVVLFHNGKVARIALRRV